MHSLLKFTVVVWLLGASLCQSFARDHKGIQPAGNSTGAVQFDSVIELNNPRSHSHAILFVRYWVAADYYHLAIIWSEPQGTRLPFPITPASLSVGSDSNALTVTHGIYPKIDTNYSKPFDERGVFAYRYGDYPIPNVRFAEAEAASERIYVEDLLEGIKGAPQNSRDRSFSILDDERALEEVKVRARGGTIDSLELMGDSGQMVKRVEYEYDSNQLRKQKVFIPESQLTVDLGKPATVTINSNKYEVQKFPMLYHKGGRTAVVDYASVQLDGAAKSILPSHVEVRNAASNVFLRSAQLQNFRPIKLTSSEARNAAVQFGGIGPECRKVLELAKKYRSASRKLNVEDAKAIEVLLAYFKKEPTIGESVGEKLRRINMQITLNRIKEDMTDLDKTYQQYLSTLAENHLSTIMLEGGYGMVALAAREERYQQAGHLLEQLIAAVTNAVSFAIAHQFITNEFSHGDQWVVLRMIQAFESQARSSVERFEHAAMASIAARRLRILLNERGRLKNGPGKVAAEFAASQTDDEFLQKSQENWSSKAHEIQNALASLNSFQSKLLKELGREPPATGSSK